MKRPFEQAVTEHGAVVLRVCRAVLGPTEADDAWSETFLSALRAWPGLPDDANVRAWLVTIAHRKAVDVLRTRNRTAIPVEELPEAPSRLGLPGGRDLDLWAALATLPERQRFAVVQHHLGGLPFAQVAELTGGSPDAARKAASDGVQRLRILLSHEEDPA
jgi:RNA polymerase sigma factor (sigma-70 family)